MGIRRSRTECKRSGCSIRLIPVREIVLNVHARILLQRYHRVRLLAAISRNRRSAGVPTYGEGLAGVENPNARGLRVARCRRFYQPERAG